MVGEEGFEPPIIAPEAIALPLGYSPIGIRRLTESQKKSRGMALRLANIDVWQ